MLTAFDDYPIHPSADPIAHPATGDPNHYDRYFFNGVSVDGDLFLAGAMGHYPVRGVVDAAFSVVVDGVEHSLFASGRMPFDRSTEVGPLRVEVVEPLKTIRLIADPSAEGIGADLTFRARTPAIEEPRQRRVTADGILVMDHTRLTQWGTWEGTITVDGRQLTVDPAKVRAVRDRSWGTRGVGVPVSTNRPPQAPQVFWMWAPLHFDDVCTHLALHEYASGNRWLQTARYIALDPAGGALVEGADAGGELDFDYELEWVPGRREARRAVFKLADGAVIELETLYTFRMRGIGYSHPKWAHGSNHGELEVGRESIALGDFDPLDISSVHLQNIVRARIGERTGVGVLEQFVLGPHVPTGLTGLLDPVGG